MKIVYVQLTSKFVQLVWKYALSNMLLKAVANMWSVSMSWDPSIVHVGIRWKLINIYNWWMNYYYTEWQVTFYHRHMSCQQVITDSVSMYDMGWNYIWKTFNCTEIANYVKSNG